MKKFLAILTAGLLLMAVGCSDGPTDTSGLEQNLNLEDEFGGYLATNEAAAFGDIDLAGEAAADEAFDDPILLTPGIDSLIDDPDGRWYHIRILWGKLRYDSTVVDLTDWTGSLSITRGVEVIRRVIRFELGQDYIPTRTDRSLIEWVSYTTVHHDGIAADIYVPNDTSATLEMVEVTFETGPYSRTFSIDELQSLDTIVYLEDSNAVAFSSFELDRRICPRGFLGGYWGYDENGEGVFNGLWMTRNGCVAGYINGHFGVNNDSLKVFFGKWISMNGQFEGLIRGVWNNHPSVNSSLVARRHAGGWFAGDIFNADEQKIGVLKGKYKSHPQFKKGHFSGRWKLNCVSVEPEPDDLDEGF